MQLRLTIALGADSTSNNRKGGIHWKVGTKSNTAKCKAKVGIREEKCNHPKVVILVAMPGRFNLI